jgi:hypothetical protein
VFNQITSPKYVVKHACHLRCNVPKYRVVWLGYYALAEVLGLLQERWTAEELVQQWAATVKVHNFKQKVSKLVWIAEYNNFYKSI